MAWAFAFFCRSSFLFLSSAAFPSFAISSFSSISSSSWWNLWTFETMQILNYTNMKMGHKYKNVKLCKCEYMILIALLIPGAAALLLSWAPLPGTWNKHNKQNKQIGKTMMLEVNMQLWFHNVIVAQERFLDFCAFSPTHLGTQPSITEWIRGTKLRNYDITKLQNYENTK